MIVVSMTSWTKRIENVKVVVESIMKNTMKPDRVYLNLSEEEFKNKELDLPKDLVEYFNSDERLIINWVGRNTKTFKKVFPILKYLNDDDIIILSDDDMLFPEDLIENRVNEFMSQKQPISKYEYSEIDKNDFGYGTIISPTSIFQKKMLDKWEKFVTEDIILAFDDDKTYTAIMLLNGYKPQTTNGVYTHNGLKKYTYNAKKYNESRGILYDIKYSSRINKERFNSVIKNW